MLALASIRLCRMRRRSNQRSAFSPGILQTAFASQRRTLNIALRSVAEKRSAHGAGRSKANFYPENVGSQDRSLRQSAYGGHSLRHIERGKLLREMRRATPFSKGRFSPKLLTTSIRYAGQVRSLQDKRIGAEASVWGRRGGSFGMNAVELGAQRLQLMSFELGDAQRRCRAGECRTQRKRPAPVISSGHTPISHSPQFLQLLDPVLLASRTSADTGATGGTRRCVSETTSTSPRSPKSR